ncbi:Bifunctional epoxide hydrolase 2 [Aphelenchoides besseyi]|nr:Bifunctional epoxide hydrolase 2 [Aphelenchoides besseyi]
MKPSCVIFDMGGVVVRFKNYDRFVELLQEARKDPKVGEKFVGFELGTVSAEEIRDTFHRIFPLPLDVDVNDFENSKLDDYMGDHDPHIEKAIEKLKANGIKLGLLTNNGYWNQIFDVVVESAREGVRKPDPKIYEIMLERIGKKAEECIFIDDLKQNVDAAANLGFIGIHLANEDSEAAVKKLEELLDLELH